MTKKQEQIANQLAYIRSLQAQLQASEVKMKATQGKLLFDLEQIMPPRIAGIVFRLILLCVWIKTRIICFFFTVTLKEVEG